MAAAPVEAGVPRSLSNRGLSRKQLDSRIMGKERKKGNDRASRDAVILWLITGFILKQAIVMQKGDDTKRSPQVVPRRAGFWH